MIIGKTVEEAVKLTNKAVVEALDGLPSQKIHCSVLAEQAVKAALYDYATKNNITIEGLEDFNPVDDIHDHEHGHDEEE